MKVFQYNSSNCIGVTPVFVENNDIMRSTATAVAVIALFASIFTVTLNALVLFVFYRLKQLQTPSSILIVNMCIADFLTGCISEPLFLSARLLELYDTDKCSVKQAGLFFGYLFSGISFITLCFISIERCYSPKIMIMLDAFVVYNDSKVSYVALKWAEVASDTTRKSWGILIPLPVPDVNEGVLDASEELIELLIDFNVDSSQKDVHGLRMTALDISTSTMKASLDTSPGQMMQKRGTKMLMKLKWMKQRDL
eukprot:gene16625-8056_t